MQIFLRNRFLPGSMRIRIHSLAFIYPSSPEIPPFLHSSCPVFFLSCIPPNVMEPELALAGLFGWSRSRWKDKGSGQDWTGSTSLNLHVLYPTCPASQALHPFCPTTLLSCIQCCGSQMTYSGSSLEFFDLRIRFRPILLKKTHLKFNYQTESFYCLPFSPFPILNW